MTLESKIKEQYGKRNFKDNLYSGTYSNLVEIEKNYKTKNLLQNFLGDVSNKTVLEIGAGHGGNIPMLLGAGFKIENIFVNELLPERIENIRREYPAVKLFEGDALSITFPIKFDCVYQSTVFTSILNEDDRSALADKMWELVKPQGIILWYDFIYNNPKNSDVRKVSINEVNGLFKNAVKSQIERVTLAPPIGRKVGRFYQLFNFPFLRSHILGVFQK